MAQQVFPTKSNLMATRRSLALANQGYGADGPQAQHSGARDDAPD